jgi:hypothetical protein
MRKHAIIDAQATTSTKCSPEIQVKHEMTNSRSNGNRRSTRATTHRGEIDMSHQNQKRQEKHWKSLPASAQEERHAL